MCSTGRANTKSVLNSSPRNPEKIRKKNCKKCQRRAIHSLDDITFQCLQEYISVCFNYGQAAFILGLIKSDLWWSLMYLNKSYNTSVCRHLTIDLRKKDTISQAPQTHRDEGYRIQLARYGCPEQHIHK